LLFVLLTKKVPTETGKEMMNVEQGMLNDEGLVRPFPSSSVIHCSTLGITSSDQQPFLSVHLF
jgi:hypothetical protein